MRRAMKRRGYKAMAGLAQTFALKHFYALHSHGILDYRPAAQPAGTGCAYRLINAKI